MLAELSGPAPTQARAPLDGGAQAEMGQAPKLKQKLKGALRAPRWLFRPWCPLLTQSQT